MPSRHHPVFHAESNPVTLTCAAHGAQYVGEETETPSAVAAQANAAAEDAGAVGEGASAPSGVRTSALLGWRGLLPHTQTLCLQGAKVK